MYQLPSEWCPLRIFGAWEEIKSRPARVRNPHFEFYPSVLQTCTAILSMASTADMGKKKNVFY